MIRVLSTNIVSPLGYTSAENYQSIKSGRTGLRQYHDLWGIPGTVSASLFSEDQNKALAKEGLTRFESLAYTSVKDALSRTEAAIPSQRTVFILATTKGDIENLSPQEHPNLADTAHTIAAALGIPTKPVVVCNACISGAAAQLLALRLLESGDYDYAIVCGADCQNKFVMSGFGSLKALSEDFCRPFDIERYGLNLGEAAATIIYGTADAEADDAGWYLHNGAIRNDATHISNPSKTAEGCLRAIKKALEGGVTPSLISVHGTATLYNDQMEATALKRSSLQDVPVMALKGYYGHTMGAAGILETIISILAAEEHQTLPSKGFEELGVSASIRISNEAIKTEGMTFLKIIAGFGGGNAALYFSKEAKQEAPQQPPHIRVTHKVKITPQDVVIDGTPCATEERGAALLTEIYKRYIDDYPKYYKMDGLSRLAFAASEMLIKAEGHDGDHTENRAVILFNNSSSIASDLAFLATTDTKDYYPSPSVFVYTLPNIATGEIAIRNSYHGETSFYILPSKDKKMTDAIVRTAFADDGMQSCLCGWADYTDEENFEAEMFLMNRI